MGGKEQISLPQGPEPAYTGIVGIAHLSFIEAKASLVKTWLPGCQFPLQCFPPLLRRYSKDGGCGLETPELKTLSKSLLPEQAPRLSLSHENMGRLGFKKWRAAAKSMETGRSQGLQEGRTWGKRGSILSLPSCPFRYEGRRKEKEGLTGVSQGPGACWCLRFLGYVSEGNPTSDLTSVLLPTPQYSWPGPYEPPTSSTLLKARGKWRDTPRGRGAREDKRGGLKPAISGPAFKEAQSVKVREMLGTQPCSL